MSLKEAFYYGLCAVLGTISIFVMFLAFTMENDTYYAKGNMDAGCNTHYTEVTETETKELVYTVECVVIDTRETETLVKDSTGNVWSFYGEYIRRNGNKLLVTMSDNGTPNNIYDDIYLSDEEVEAH